MFFLYLSLIFWGFALLGGVAHVISRIIEHERKPDIF